MSKAFGLAGLRIGWVASEDRSLLASIQSYKDYTTICASAPSRIPGYFGLHHKERILAKNRELLKKNQTYLTSFFNNIKISSPVQCQMQVLPYFPN